MSTSNTHTAEKQSCWVCGSYDLKRIRKSTIEKTLKSDSFAITDSQYGVTGELSQCVNCSFIQSADVTDVLSFYENLEDPTYEATRKERLLQAAKIISGIKKYKQKGRLLDIGAGSGILVEEALKQGFDASGVEPSSWLYKKAVSHNLPVVLGTFPSEMCKGNYDIITIIDVIEHVNNPKSLIASAYEALSSGGILIVVTPNVSSFAAKVLGYKWWHFRIAHIGYFNTKNLDRLFYSVGFTKVSCKSAKWYFSLDYLIKRFNVYLPSWFKLPSWSFFSRMIVPLNLFDSVLVVYVKK